MLIEDFTIEAVEVNGIPVQTFKKRYRNLRQMFSESVAAHLHPKILDVSVFGLSDPIMGSIVACAIVSRPDRERETRETRWSREN